MVSFLVVETGLREGSSAGEYSSLWEDGLMSCFFDAGHIVSNGNILRIEQDSAKELPDEAVSDFDDAVQGGAEFFVLVLLEYNNGSGSLRPATVSFRIFSTASRKMIYQRNFPAGTAASLREEYAYAIESGRAILPFLKDR
jgi:hypothetical protein